MRIYTMTHLIVCDACHKLPKSFSNHQGDLWSYANRRLPLHRIEPSGRISGAKRFHSTPHIARSAQNSKSTQFAFRGKNMWDHIDWFRWTPFYTMADVQDGREWWRNSPREKVGVYRIVAMSADWPCVVPSPVERSCGIDLTGTLYIGQGWINNRVSTHILNHRSFHPARLRMWSPSLLQKFPITQRAISWLETHSIEAARQKENELLHLYWERFGELPPVNLTRSRP